MFRTFSKIRTMACALGKMNELGVFFFLLEPNITSQPKPSLFALLQITLAFFPLCGLALTLQCFLFLSLF